MSDDYNALAGAQTPPPMTMPAERLEGGPNSRPNKDMNHGAVPSMMGDMKKIARPAYPTIASTSPTRPAAASSGMETSMAALADKMHPPRRR